MLEAAAGGLQLLLDPYVLLMVLVGALVAQVIAVVPGIGGAFTLAVLVPFVVTMDLVPGVALMVSALVTTGVGNTVTSVLFGVPGSAIGVAAIFDGYPMAKRGEGARAVSAGISASVIGGLIGAVAMAALLPVVRPLVLAFSHPEFAVLIVFAVLLIGYVGGTSFLKSMVSATFGFLLGLVGMEPSTGSLRFDFGWLYLWDGIPLVPLFIGLFAIAEMLQLMRRGGTIVDESVSAGSAAVSDLSAQRMQGLMDAVRYWRATLESSMVGLFIGILPGIGGSASQFLSYGYVARSHKGKTEYAFGEGAIEGVIAADASTNSKDGAAFIPTLAFGIPGSATFAVFLGVLITLGVAPGRTMLEENLDLVWMMLWILVLANVIAGSAVVAVISVLAKLTLVRVSFLIPVILSASLMGAYVTSLAIGDLMLALGFGVLGYYMVVAGYSRSILVIAFVLAPLLERNVILSYNLFGWDFLTRPITLTLIVLLAGGLLASSASSAVRRARDRHAVPAEEAREPGGHG